MAAAIPESTRDLFERPIVYAFTTIKPDRQPHTVPVERMGHVIEIKVEQHGARDDINSLRKKYTGNPLYQGFGNSNVDRKMYVIDMDKVHGR